jgi:hypothetical protein
VSSTGQMAVGCSVPALLATFCTVLALATTARREGVAHFRRVLPTTARLRGQRSRLCFSSPVALAGAACFQSRRIESRCAFLLFTW